ncbi:hypothetical protein JCM15519_06960 [Fundidesulfovibrio butyratiphilus]
MRVKLKGQESPAAPGSIENHFGYAFEVQEDGSLVADISDALAPGEIASGRMVEQSEDGPPKSLSDMTVKALRELAKEKGVPIPADATTKDAVVGILEAAGVTLESQA